MKKIVLAVLIGSALIAADNGLYVGVDIGSTGLDGKAKTTSTSGSYEDDISENDASQTIKIGYYFNQNNRVTAFAQNINISGGDARLYGINYDYLIGNHPLKPFVGALAGYGALEGDNGTNITGNIIGAQVGINYAFNEHLSAEAGYRYMLSSMSGSYSETDFGVDYKTDVDIETAGNFFIGLNYKF
ncbi:MAG: outer membrane beta-barrel protein [Sulfurimonas sp.]|nr:outer membrane beta-barrel protein [Sulfurimonas sp.]MDD3059651.1 outer membrane beta-barrel protein [Sulfurimonas sp.]MDD5202873.1 outer membrane beta-barrel protein [Sulfurimonas sp.]